MKRNQIIATLVSVGHKERNLQHKSNDALRKLMNLGSKKIAKIREEKAQREAELFVRMEEQKQKQREQSRCEALRLNRLTLRAAREAKEQEPIKRFQRQGFKPLPPIGVRPTTTAPTIRQRIAELDAKVEETKSALRSNRWTQQLADEAALAVLERKCFVDELPEQERRKVLAEDYVKRTTKPLFGVKA